MNLEKMLKSLALSHGAPGKEEEAAAAVISCLREFTPDCYIKNGSVIGYIGPRAGEKSKPRLLIDAHIDQIGFMVTHITEEGFLKISNAGGIDARALPAQKFIVLGGGGKNRIIGTACSIPPHLSGKDEKKITGAADIYIDVGMSEEAARKLIEPGDAVMFDAGYEKLSGDRISGAGLDNRCGAAAVLYALELMKGARLKYSLSVLFSAQEEIGERGAKTAAYDIDPDIAFVVDASFAYAPGEPETKCGKMGKGCMIGFSPALDKELSELMLRTAKERNIPYQTEVMGGTTGTNADMISVSKSGVKTVTLSIPLKYMHTPVEIVSVSDIKATAELIRAAVAE